MEDQSHGPRPKPPRHGCARRRVAESEFGALDSCSCGTWQLHVGAVTLRLAPREVPELLSLLGAAIAEHSAWRFRTEDVEEGPLFPRRSRGTA